MTLIKFSIVKILSYRYITFFLSYHLVITIRICFTCRSMFIFVLDGSYACLETICVIKVAILLEFTSVNQIYSQNLLFLSVYLVIPTPMFLYYSMCWLSHCYVFFVSLNILQFGCRAIKLLVYSAHLCNCGVHYVYNNSLLIFMYQTKLIPVINYKLAYTNDHVYYFFCNRYSSCTHWLQVYKHSSLRFYSYRIFYIYPH